MKQQRKTSPSAALGILTLAVAFAACKPPLVPTIELARKSLLLAPASVKPLSFANPVHAVTGDGPVQSVVFALTEARTGEVFVYNDSACAVPSSLVASLADSELTVTAGGGNIPEGTPFYAVIAEGGMASAPASFKLVRTAVFDAVLEGPTWADVEAQLAGGFMTVDLYNRIWDAGIVLDASGDGTGGAWAFNGRTLANGGVRDLTIRDASNVTLTGLTGHELTIAGASDGVLASECSFHSVALRDTASNVTIQDSNSFSIHQYSSGSNLVLRRSVLLFVFRGQGATEFIIEE